MKAFLSRPLFIEKFKKSFGLTHTKYNNSSLIINYSRSKKKGVFQNNLPILSNTYTSPSRGGFIKMIFSPSNTLSDTINSPRVVSSVPHLIRSITLNFTQNPKMYSLPKYFNNLLTLVNDLPLNLRQSWKKFYFLPLPLVHLYLLSRVSFASKFFNHTRFNLIDSSSCFANVNLKGISEFKSFDHDYHHSILASSQVDLKFPIKTIWNRLLIYSTFLSNLRSNPIRRPLYSTFLKSSKILRTHTFRLTSIKGMASLQKFPTRPLQGIQPLKYTGLIGSLFMSQGDSFVELNLNNTLKFQACLNSQYRLNWNTKALKAMLSKINFFFNRNYPRQPQWLGIKGVTSNSTLMSTNLLQNSTITPLPFNDVKALLNSPLSYKFFF